MTFAQIFPWVLSFAALLISLATFVRSGSWRHEDRIRKLEDTTSAHATKLSDLPTKADLAEVKSDVRSLERSVSGIDAGVTRIEQFLMHGAGK